MSSAEPVQEAKPAPATDPDDKPPRKRNFVGWIVMLAIIGIGAFYGIHAYTQSLIREVTDNAQVDATITPVSPRVRGQVLEVKVDDNDVVHKGDLLFTIDPSDYQTKVDQAESALVSARNQLAQSKLQVSLAERSSAAQVEERRSSITVTQQQVVSAGQAVAVARAEAARSDSDIAGARSRIAQAQAQVKTAQAQLDRSEAEAKRLRDDRERYRLLFQKREVSQQQYEAAASGAEQAESQVDAARQQVHAARAAVGAAQAVLANAQAARQVAVEGIRRAEAGRGEAQARIGEAQGRYQEAQAGTLEASVARVAVEGHEAEVKRAESNLEQARLELSYTKVYAPSDGTVTRKNIDPGQYVEIGAPALALVDEKDMWVVANFKETQMEHMTVGQRATLEIDTYPDTPLQGKVESIQAGTGSVFSLLPPENASGSFVKVVQRIPVKIVFDSNERRRLPLRPGMSVEATVWLQ
jgi:membrane fusion protein (multidrug efflux system)